MPISFTTTHGELSVALDAMTALSPRPVLPFAGVVRIRVGWDRAVTLESFDGATHVAVALAARSILDSEDTVLVDRAKLTGYVRSLTAGSTKAKQAGLPVTIHADGPTVRVEADGYDFDLAASEVEFPEPPTHPVANLVTLDRDTMLATVTRLQMSASTDATLPMLTGVSVRSTEGGLELATTDRFRLSLAFVPTEEDERDIKALVPAKILSTIFRYLPAGPVRCDFAAGWARFVGGPVRIATELLDSEFVKYQLLIPDKGRGDVVVSRSDLAVAVKRAAVTVDRGHHIRFNFAGSRAQITAGGATEGRVSSPSFRTEQTGEDMEGPVAFNPQYIGDALATFGSDAISIRYTKAARPVLIAEPGELDNPRAFRTLVMPARLPA